MKIVIWHNPRCSKSRQTLALIQELNYETDIRHYLEDTPSKTEINETLILLGIEASSLARKSEKILKEIEPPKTDEDWINTMVAHPILIERPIVFANSKAAIGRPPEAVLEIL